MDVQADLCLCVVLRQCFFHDEAPIFDQGYRYVLELQVSAIIDYHKNIH